MRCKVVGFQKFENMTRVFYTPLEYENDNINGLVVFNSCYFGNFVLKLDSTVQLNMCKSREGNYYIRSISEV